MANAPILIGGASITVLSISGAPGGLAGLKLLSQSGPALSIQVDGGFGFSTATLPLTLSVGQNIRLTRTDTSTAVSVIQASYSDGDPDGDALSLSGAGGIGSGKPPPYNQQTPLAAVSSVSIIYTGRGIGLRGANFTVPMPVSKIGSIEVRDFDNNTSFVTVDPQRIIQNGQNGISFPALGLNARNRLNINFTEPVNLPTLANPQLSPDTQVIRREIRWARCHYSACWAWRGGCSAPSRQTLCRSALIRPSCPANTVGTSWPRRGRLQNSASFTRASPTP